MGRKQKAAAEDDGGEQVNTQTGEIIAVHPHKEATTEKQIQRLAEIRAVELTIAKLESTIDDDKYELKELRTGLKKKQKYRHALISSDPADELPFED